MNVVNSYNFPISDDLIQMANFPTWIPDCYSHSPSLLDLRLSSDIKFVLQQLSLHWETLIILFYQFPLTFHQTQNRMSHFNV